LKKILFCTRSGLEQDNSTGGQILRIKTSIKSLRHIAKVDVVSRNPRFSKNKKFKYLKIGNFYYAPSVTKLLSNNKILKAIQWRVRELFNLYKDAKYIANLYKKNNYDCLWVSYASQSYLLINAIKKIDKKIKIISDTDSVYYKFIEREIEYSNFIRKIILFFYSRVYKVFERKLINISNITTAVSITDKKIFLSLGKSKKIYLFRNSVEIKKYKKKGDISKSYNIIISGTFGGSNSPMNISTEWFLNEIYPIIQKRIKNLKVYLVGMNSDIFFNNFNNHAQNITATGWVKSIKKYFEIADLAVVPLLYESGTRFKILEAAVHRIAVISTTLGAEGLALKNNKHIILENNAKKFANKMVYLSKNKKVTNILASNNYKIVASNFNLLSQVKDAKIILKNL